MPNTQINKSAEKRARQDQRKRAKNRVLRGYVRDMMRTVRAEKDPDAAEKQLPHAYSTLDKAAKKNILHKRTVARYKSRLVAHTKKLKEK